MTHSDYSLFQDVRSFEAIVEELEQYDRDRREIGNLSALALKNSKKAIFALQRRRSAGEAWKTLEAARAVLADLDGRFGGGRHLGSHGQWRVAREEFLEALYFLRFCEGNPLPGTSDEFLGYDHEEVNRLIRFRPDDVFGALSDMTGEIMRQMEFYILEENYDGALRANRAIAQAAELLNQNNSSGDLRRKVEQANRNLHHSDSRLTDLKIRGLM